nr:MAG TPA: putative transcriptional regulator [Caudoviricetes sp.]
MNALELKNIRKEYNITQERLAEIVGSSIRAVQSWEQGQRNIPQSAIKLLNFFLKEKGADVDILPLTSSQQKNILKKLKKLFISLRNRISKDQQQAFKQYEALLSQGETIVTHELIQEIVTTFPDINKEWLTDNKGTMFLSDNTLINGKDLSHSISKLKSKNGTEEVSPVAEQNYMIVEYADLAVSAGMLGGDFSEAFVESLPETHKRLIPREYNEGNYLVVRVNGDSMDDGSKRSLSDDDEILIRLWTDSIDTLPIRSKLFVLTTRSGHIVKQITKIDHKKQQITCHSFNPLYPDQIVDFDEVIQLFTVEKIVNSKIRF